MARTVPDRCDVRESPVLPARYELRAGPRDSGEPALMRRKHLTAHICRGEFMVTGLLPRIDGGAA